MVKTIRTVTVSSSPDRSAASPGSERVKTIRSANVSPSPESSPSGVKTIRTVNVAPTPEISAAHPSHDASPRSAKRKKGKIKAVNTASFRQMFCFYNKLDWMVTFTGFIFAILHGASTPFGAVFLGDATTALGSAMAACCSSLAAVMAAC